MEDQAFSLFYDLASSPSPPLSLLSVSSTGDKERQTAGGRERGGRYLGEWKGAKSYDGVES